MQRQQTRPRWKRLFHRSPSAPPSPSAEPGEVGPEPVPSGGSDRLQAAIGDFIGGVLTSSERERAEKEGARDEPAATAQTPTGSELLVRRRIRDALDRLRHAGDLELGRLDSEREALRLAADRHEEKARQARDTIAQSSPNASGAEGIHHRRNEWLEAQRRLDAFRKTHALDGEVPRGRPSRRGSWLIVTVIFLVESLFNGLILHGGSTEGLLLNWGLALLVGGINVFLLAWLLGDVFLRHWRFSGLKVRLGGVAAALAAVFCAVILHFGLAHYRDAGTALANSLRDGSEAPRPTRHRSITIEAAVLNELRTQLHLFPRSYRVTSHPSSDPDDHTGDESRVLPAGRAGYRAAGGAFYLTEDAGAGRFDGWPSVVLCMVGFLALFLAAWKWYRRDAPSPWGRLHRRADRAWNRLWKRLDEELNSLEDAKEGHFTTLAGAVSGIRAAGRGLDRVHSERAYCVERENELRKQALRTGADLVNAYRETNRARRSSAIAHPAFWDHRWTAPDDVGQPRRVRAEWKDHDEQDAAELQEILDRTKSANRQHKDDAEELFRKHRESLEGAAHGSGWAATGGPPPSGDVAPMTGLGASGGGAVEEKGGNPAAASFAGQGGRAITLILLAGLWTAPSPVRAAECPEWPDDPDQRATRYVVVVDASEGFSDSQRAALWREVESLAEESRPKSVFHVYQIHAQREAGFGLVPPPVCRPPRGSEVSIIWDNPPLRDAQWEPRFIKPLQQAVFSAASGGESEASPILEAIQAAADHFRGARQGPPDQYRLLLVSDLMQFSGESFYEAVPTIEEFRETLLYRGVRTRRLKDVSITVLRMPVRPHGVPDAQLVGFWAAYFRDQGMRGDEQRCGAAGNEDAGAEDLLCAFDQLEGLPAWAEAR